jgi:hypothetical protein
MTRSTGFSLEIAAFVLTLALTITVGGARAIEQPAALDDDQRFTRLTASVDLALDGTEMGEIHAERFEALWSDHDYGAGLEDASDKAVLLRLRAAGTAAFYEPAGWVLERYRAALAEAHARGIATEEHFRDMFDAYLSASRHDQASALTQDYPDIELPEVPEIVPPESAPSDNDRTLWRVVEDPLRLEGFHVDLDAPRLLIVSSPGCGFCRMAARALPADDVLGPLMREHAIWLAAKSSGNTYPRMLRFNGEYPEAQHYFVDAPGEWPMPGFNATPRFHFVKDGETVETLAGWGGGSEALWAIARGFESIALLDAGSLPEDAFAYADEETGPDRCPTRDEARELIAERTPIMTQEDLDTHLAHLRAGGGDSPLLALSPEARKRLVDSVRFGKYGVIGFRIDDMRAQLEPDQIHALASLFGMQYFYAGMFFPTEMLSEEDKDLKAMFECTGKYAQAESSAFSPARTTERPFPSEAFGVNVVDYGAVPDSDQDATAAIQAALDDGRRDADGNPIHGDFLSTVA